MSRSFEVPARVPVSWEFSESSEARTRASFWNGMADLELEADGTIRLSLPAEVPKPAKMQPELPGFVRLSFSPPGCRPVLRSIEPAMGEVDLGDLPLDARIVTFELAPGHGLEDEDARYATLRFEVGGETRNYQIRDSQDRAPRPAHRTRHESHRPHHHVARHRPDHR